MDGEKLIEDMAVTGGRKHRPGFYHNRVMGLSIAVILLGLICLGLGSAVLVVALSSSCIYEHRNYDYPYGQTEPPPTYDAGPCNYYFTYTSPGIWSGLMYLASGIIGVLAAKRKTTCLIVCMMILALSTVIFALGAVTFGVIANFDSDWNQWNPYPLFLHIADSLIALFGLVAFILSWIKFGFACRAVCCNGKKLCPASTKPCFQYQYQPLYSQPIMYAGSSDQFAHGLAPLTQPTTQQAGTATPIYLVQGNQVIGVFPANAPQMQAMMGKQANTGGTEAATQA